MRPGDQPCASYVDRSFARSPTAARLVWMKENWENQIKLRFINYMLYYIPVNNADSTRVTCIRPLCLAGEADTHQLTVSFPYHIKGRIYVFTAFSVYNTNAPHSAATDFYPTSIIIGDLWISELDSVTLFVRHGQMTHFGVYPWVFSFSIWPGQGFYVELFSIYAFASEYQTKMKRTFRLE